MHKALLFSSILVFFCAALFAQNLEVSFAESSSFEIKYELNGEEAKTGQTYRIDPETTTIQIKAKCKDGREGFSLSGFRLSEYMDGKRDKTLKIEIQDYQKNNGVWSGSFKIPSEQLVNATSLSIEPIGEYEIRTVSLSLMESNGTASGNWSWQLENKQVSGRTGGINAALPYTVSFSLDEGRRSSQFCSSAEPADKVLALTEDEVLFHTQNPSRNATPATEFTVYLKPYMTISLTGEAKKVKSIKLNNEEINLKAVRFKGGENLYIETVAGYELEENNCFQIAELVVDSKETWKYQVTVVNEGTISDPKLKVKRAESKTISLLIKNQGGEETIPEVFFENSGKELSDKDLVDGKNLTLKKGSLSTLTVAPKDNTHVLLTIEDSSGFKQIEIQDERSIAIAFEEIGNLTLIVEEGFLMPESLFKNDYEVTYRLNGNNLSPNTFVKRGDVIEVSIKNLPKEVVANMQGTTLETTRRLTVDRTTKASDLKVTFADKIGFSLDPKDYSNLANGYVKFFVNGRQVTTKTFVESGETIVCKGTPAKGYTLLDTVDNTRDMLVEGQDKTKELFEEYLRFVEIDGRKVLMDKLLQPEVGGVAKYYLATENGETAIANGTECRMSDIIHIVLEAKQGWRIKDNGTYSTTLSIERSCSWISQSFDVSSYFVEEESHKASFSYIIDSSLKKRGLFGMILEELQENLGGFSIELSGDVSKEAKSLKDKATTGTIGSGKPLVIKYSGNTKWSDSEGEFYILDCTISYKTGETKTYHKAWILEESRGELVLGEEIVGRAMDTITLVLKKAACFVLPTIEHAKVTVEAEGNIWKSGSFAIADTKGATITITSDKDYYISYDGQIYPQENTYSQTKVSSYRFKEDVTLKDFFSTKNLKIQEYTRVKLNENTNQPYIKVGKETINLETEREYQLPEGTKIYSKGFLNYIIEIGAPGGLLELSRSDFKVF